MAFVIHLNTGTQKASALPRYLSANPERLSTAWPETIGLNEAMKAGIAPDDYGWFIEDMQKATITRLGDDQFQIAMNDSMQPTTPDVFAALAGANNRLGHAHYQLACYTTQAGRIVPINAKQPPIPFGNRDENLGTAMDANVSPT